MSNGWIKLHRKLLLNPIAKRPQYAWLWILLLLKANHREDKFMWNGDVIVVKEGQLITGRKALAEEIGSAQSTVEDILKFLESQQQIRQQKTNKFRLITIVNWKEYQQTDINSDNKPTTSRQQADTNKNNKKYKNTSAVAQKDSSSEETGNQKDKDLLLVDSSKHVLSNGLATSGEEISAELVDDNGDPYSPKKKADTTYRKVFNLFGRYPANWNQNRTEIAAAKNILQEHGLEKAVIALEFYRSNREEADCPQILKPSDLDRKWKNLQAFKKRHA